MPTPASPIKVKLPVPVTLPPFCAVAAKSVMTSCAPEKRPRALTPCRRMPVTGLLIAALPVARSEEHTSELQSLMRISYAVFCLKKKKDKNYKLNTHITQE